MATLPYIAIREDEQSIALSIVGDINGDFNWPSLKHVGNKTVTIDLSQVQFVNSVGVKNWVKNFPYKRELVELVDVSVQVMDCFNMTPAMQLGCRVRSFYLPVYCEKCHETFKLISVSDLNLNEPDQKIKLKACTCGNAIEPDTDIVAYLTCLRRAV